MSKSHQLQIPGTPIMVKGLKADYHVDKHKLKMAKCPFDAGFDLYPDRSDIKIKKMAACVVFTIGTSLHVHYMPGTYGRITSRSSSIDKLDGGQIVMAVIDSGYVGELLVRVMSPCDAWQQVLEAIKVCQRDEVAIAQMVSQQCLVPMFAQWDDRNVVGGRGANGFGHSDLFLGDKMPGAITNNDLRKPSN